MFSCFSRQIPTTAFAAPVVSLSPTWPLPINPDFVARPQSRVSFQSHFLTLLLWPFHCSLDPSGCELTQGWGKAPWYSGQLTHAHFYSSHGHLHWDPRPSLCPAPPQSGAITQSGAPKCSICVCNLFSLQVLICIFSIMILFCFFLLYLWLPPNPQYFSPRKCWDHFWLQTLWVSHTHWFPPVWMPPLHLAPAAAASSPRHGESGTLSSNLPLLITSLYPETAIWLSQIPE